MGDLGHWSLSGHQNTFIVERLHHVQRAVRQNHLLRCDLQKKRMICFDPITAAAAFKPLPLYLHVQQVRQLLRLVVSRTTSCIGDKNNRKQKVLVLVHELPEGTPSSRDHGSTAQEDAIDIKEDAHLAAGQVGDR